MPRRLDPAKVSPAALKTMLDIEGYLAKCGLERPLIHLIKMRASQINGCAYCLDMHSKDARAEGDTEQRLYALDAWRETPFYSARERAALAWTEALTLISQTHAPDDVYREARAQFLGHKPYLPVVPCQEHFDDRSIAESDCGHFPWQIRSGGNSQPSMEDIP